MTKYKIKAYTRNKNTLDNFLRFCKQPLKKPENFLVVFNFARKRKIKKIVSILRSPHVNKKAQEQYQRITYMYVLTYITWDEEKSLLYLKKVKNNLFPDLIIKIEKTQFTKTANNIIRKVLTNPYTVKNLKTIFFSLKYQQKNKDLSNKKLGRNAQTSLKNLDNYGSQPTT